MPTSPDTVAAPRLTVRAIRAVPVEIPLTFVLGTSQTAIRRAPLLLVDVETEEGITGRTYLFCYVPAAALAIVNILNDIAALTKGDHIAPLDLWAKLSKRFALIGVQGVVRMAMAGFDTACWDALARALKLPLATLLGAQPRKIPAYNSCGLGLMADKGALAAEALALQAMGFAAVKLRLGYATLAEDIAAVRAVRKAIGDDAPLMVDYNQLLGLNEALARGYALDGEGVYWLEEPIRHDDYKGNATLAAKLKTPVQIGENFSESTAMEVALEHRAANFVMPDLERIGGVTGWLRAASVAAVHRIEMSSHLFPEVSAHLLAATPTCHWLEYVDWINGLVQEPLAISGGFAIVPDRAGNGIVWNEDAVQRHRMM